MGYRFYIGAIKNTSLDRIKNIDSIPKINRIVATWNRKVDLDDESINFLHVWNLPNRTIDQIGDIIVQEQYSLPQTPVFNNKEVNDAVTKENALFLVSKETLLLIIRIYQEHTTKWLESIVAQIDGPDMLTETSPESYVKTKARQWASKSDLIVDIDEERPERIVSSWDYEYAIFDLVHLYKTFDFEQESLMVFAF